MATGLQMVKKELGPDALILSTRTIRDKSVGLLGRPIFEITAAIDGEPPASLSAPPHFRATTGKKHGSERKKAPFSHVVDDSLEDFLAAGQTVKSQDSPSSFPRKVHRKDSGTGEVSLQDEVSELKHLVQSLSRQINSIAEAGKAAAKPARHLQVNSRGILEPRDEAVQGDHILSSLVERGINVETARTVTSFIRESYTERELSHPAGLQAAIVDTIQNLIEVNPAPQPSPGAQRRIALVGPTGVGKTTTLAKLAAAHLKDHSDSVALITIDTYRIAAVEQLRIYGDIMRLPLEIVISPEQLEQALARHSDKELILIDTAGRSPNDSLSIDELGTFFKPGYGIEKHLVLSASTRENELVNSIGRFSGLDIASTVFTKIDECSSLGILLNVQLRNPAPLSYITNGQKVPEDLLHINPRLVAQLIMSQDEGSLHD